MQREDWGFRSGDSEDEVDWLASTVTADNRLDSVDGTGGHPHG